MTQKISDEFRSSYYFSGIQTDRNDWPFNPRPQCQEGRIWLSRSNDAPHSSSRGTWGKAPQKSYERKGRNPLLFNDTLLPIFGEARGSANGAKRQRTENGVKTFFSKCEHCNVFLCPRKKRNCFVEYHDERYFQVAKLLWKRWKLSFPSRVNLTA